MNHINDLKSHVYWNENSSRIYQKFYVAFCLLNSALFDYSVGLDLKLQKKLNWSASCYYYSMVHCARLLLFIPFGNFPSGHTDMINYLTNNSQFSGKFDWFYKFLNNSKESRKVVSKSADDRNIMIDLYKNKYKISNYDERFEKFSTNLSNAKSLRQDSNYEALLIAHENFHPKLEKLFKDLVDTISKKSYDGICFLIEVFKQHIKTDFSKKESDRLISFVNESLDDKVRKRIFDRINSSDCKNEINNLLNRILIQEEGYIKSDNPFVTDLERSISLEIFNEKQGLFDKFRDDINKLRDST